MTTPSPNESAARQLLVEPRPLSSEQEGWIDAACRCIDEDRLRALVSGMVDIPSPTGEERPLAEHLTTTMQAADIHAWYQPIDDRQGNAVGRLAPAGAHDGADLLLYAPIDTLTAGVEDEDVPWIGPALRPDMRPGAEDVGDLVVGLGASNPKGHGACILAAAEAVQAAGVPLRGGVWLGFGAGGMPTNRRESPAIDRHNTGQGNGCSFLLEQGVQADFAVITKPGWTVAWEEVGLCWFRIRVEGAFGYVGSRHRIAYRNPIVEAAKVITALEEWFPAYVAANTSGLVAPQANIGAIRGGWTRTASLSPAACDLYVDLRISPRTTPPDARRQFAEAMRSIEAAHPDLRLSWDMVLAIPGTSTDPASWIVQSCGRAWEAVAGRPHETMVDTSGATDANILRQRGIPTARVGMPKVSDNLGVEVDFAMGMNAVDVTEMSRLTKLLIRTIVDTCTRTRAEIGVSS